MPTERNPVSVYFKVRAKSTCNKAKSTCQARVRRRSPHHSLYNLLWRAMLHTCPLPPTSSSLNRNLITKSKLFPPLPPLWRLLHLLAFDLHHQKLFTQQRKLFSLRYKLMVVIMATLLLYDLLRKIESYMIATALAPTNQRARSLPLIPLNNVIILGPRSVVAR